VFVWSLKAATQSHQTLCNDTCMWPTNKHQQLCVSQIHTAHAGNRRQTEQHWHGVGTSASWSWSSVCSMMMSTCDNNLNPSSPLTSAFIKSSDDKQQYFLTQSRLMQLTSTTYTNLSPLSAVVTTSVTTDTGVEKKQTAQSTKIRTVNAIVCNVMSNKHSV